MVGSLYLGYHASPEKVHTWGSSLPEAAIQVGVKLLVAFRETGLIGLEDPGCHLPGVTSLFAGPAPLPGPGLGLATPLGPLARGSGCYTWVTTLGSKRATRGGSSLPESGFRVGVKAAGCIPGDRLDLA